MSSVVLDLVFLEMLKVLLVSVLAAVGISPLKGPLWRNRFGFTVMTNYRKPFQKMTGQRGELMVTQNCVAEVRTIAEGSRLDWNHHYALTTLKKPWNSQLRHGNLTELMCHDCGIVQSSVKIWSQGILDTVAYNVARKTKIWPLTWDRKALKQTGNQRRITKRNHQLCLCFNWLSRWKRLPTAAVPADSSMLRESLPSLARLGLDVTYTATSEIKSSIQVVQP